MLKDESKRDALQRLQAVREGGDLADVYGSEWCFDMPRQFRADLSATLSTPPAQAEASTLPGEVVVVEGANSHYFDLRLMLGDEDGECIAFADEPWASRIAAALATPPTTPAVESGEASTTNPLTALRAFVTAYKASNEPRSGAMYDAYLSGSIAVRAGKGGVRWRSA